MVHADRGRVRIIAEHEERDQRTEYDDGADNQTRETGRRGINARAAAEFVILERFAGVVRIVSHNVSSKVYAGQTQEHRACSNMMRSRRNYGDTVAHDSLQTMLHAFAILLSLQLAGEALVRALSLPLPGPVAGLSLLLVWLIAKLPLPQSMDETTDGILKHLSLLFVPAGVGLVQQLPLLRDEGWKLLIVILVSVAVSLVATAVTFAALAKLMKIDSEAGREP
ncbi:MAG TPA: CidA/LrgA family protein [Xanthobacteraceae bacterium]|nr:CidA/LrgA family protein [Xanthobacteraceae bacterium]